MEIREKNQNNYCVILAGGKGKRLWPCSRTEKPKQFLDFFGQGRTQLQQTYDRFARILPRENILISTTKDYAHIVREQLPDVAENNLMIEPVNRNTGPATTWAGMKICRRNSKARMIVTPSDQHITNEARFASDVLQALDYVGRHDVLLTMGVVPTRPEPGYGYIQMGEGAKMENVYSVQSFVEKPERDFAKMFMENGEFLWNTGLFLSSAPYFVKRIIELFGSELKLTGVTEVLNMAPGAVQAFIDEKYSMFPNISIDYGVLERTEKVEVMKCNFGWADLGTWHGIYEFKKRADNDNVLVDTDAVMDGCHNCVVKMPSDRLAIIHGLDGYIVAEHDNVLLICPKEDSSAMIKKYFNDVQMKKGEEYV